MEILGSTYLGAKHQLRSLTGSDKRSSRQRRLAEQFLNEWLDAQGSSAAELDQQHLLDKVLQFAADQVPFYRAYFARHADKNPERLEDWPILTRDHLWQNSVELQAAAPGPWKTWTHASGGSTGKPVSVVHDEFFAARAQALRWLCSRLFFKGPHYNQLILWGMHGEVDNNRRAGLRERIQDGLRKLMEIKTSHINTFEFTSEKFEQCVHILRKQKPRFIFGYAGSIYELAKYLDERSIRPARPPVMIGTTAQMLHPFMRERIERVFGCRICDHYGSREVGPAAWQHPNGDMYFPSFFSKIEVVDPSGEPVAPGETGRILVTTLHNFTMPLIRYDIGDTGVLGEECRYHGLPFTALKQINGRLSEEFINTRGSRICAPFFINQFYYRPWLDQFYIVQRDYTHIDILYVPKNTQPSSDERCRIQRDMAEINQNIRKVMSDDCRVVWKVVDEVPTTKAGKRLFIRSELS